MSCVVQALSYSSTMTGCYELFSPWNMVIFWPKSQRIVRYTQLQLWCRVSAAAQEAQTQCNSRPSGNMSAPSCWFCCAKSMEVLKLFVEHVVEHLNMKRDWHSKFELGSFCKVKICILAWSKIPRTPFKHHAKQWQMNEQKSNLL